MPLPGGLWWLLCCRRGFTLLHRDYGDGEFSGDGDEDEDEETFELRTPGSMGGGRVSTGEPGLRLCAPRGAPDPAATLAKRSDELNAARGRRAPHSRGARGPCRIPGAVHLLRARGSGVSRVARPGPASAFPAGPASHPVSFRLRQRQGMWRGRPGGSIAWVLCTPLWRMRSQILELPPCGHGRGPGRYGLQKRGSASLRGPHGGGAGGYDALSLGTELSAFTGEVP